MVATLAIPQSFGTYPVSRFLWKIVSSYGAISCVNSLSTLDAMESVPYALAELSVNLIRLFLCDDALL